jgi:hypothetical protein
MEDQVSWLIELAVKPGALDGFKALMAKWAERFLASVDVTRFTVYGSPNAAAKEMLDGFGAVYLGPWGGFSR